MPGCGAQAAEVVQVRTGQSAFTIDIRAKECGAERLKRRHYLLRLQGNGLSPALRGDLAAISIERKHDSFARNGMVQGAQKAKVDLSFCKCRAADNDLRRAALHELDCTR